MIFRKDAMSFSEKSGSITTYYLKEDNSPIQDKEYSWKIVAIEDVYYPLIELIWQANIDDKNGDEPNNRFYYRIEELTPGTSKRKVSVVIPSEML